MIKPPSQLEVEAMFVALLEGKVSRDKADRWASQWVTMDSPPDMPSAIWGALQKLYGCDLRHGQGLGYLHSEEQISEWLLMLRKGMTNRQD